MHAFHDELEKRLLRAARRQARLGRLAFVVPRPPGGVLVPVCALVLVLAAAVLALPRIQAGGMEVPAEDGPAPRNACDDRIERVPTLTDRVPEDALLDAFAVFRRDPRPGDPPSSDWTGLVSGPAITGIHARFGRLAAEVSGVRYYLAPVAHLPEKSPSAEVVPCSASEEDRPARRDARPGVCAVFVAKTSHGGGCVALQRVLDGTAVRQTPRGRGTTGRKVVYGPVTDRVVALRIEFDDGSVLRLAPRDNLIVANLDRDIYKAKRSLELADGTMSAIPG